MRQKIYGGGRPAVAAVVGPKEKKGGEGSQFSLCTIDNVPFSLLCTREKGT